MRFRSFFTLRAGLVACVLGIAVAGGAIKWYWSSSRPNIILVTFDTTRPDHLGAYGYEKGLTKAFDEFASRGVLFEQAYTPAPVTLPSHVTMLTSLLPPEHDLRVNGSGRLSPDVPFLPEILKKHGYDTGAFIAAAAVLGAQFGLDRGFDTYDDDPPGPSARPGPYADKRRDGHEVVGRAIAWMQQRTSRPFFCWIHLYDAHAPHMSRPEVYGQRFEQNPYDAGIAWEIQQFERVTAFLNERKLDSKTVVVIAGDHGEGLEDHGELEHGMLVYNTTLQVPLVFAGTPNCQPGTRVTSAVSLADLMPTLLDMLNISGPDHVSGRSLLPALKGQGIESRDCYAEAEMPYTMSRWCPLQTVISDRWKYIQSTRPELYDLEQDPDELTNLVDSADVERERLQTLLATMQRAFQRTAADTAELTEQDMANLRSLGYVSGGTSSQSADKTDADKALETDEVLIDVKDMMSFYKDFEQAKYIAAEGRLDEAVAILQKTAWSTDAFPMSDMMLGDFLVQAGRDEEAQAIYRSVLARRPDYVRAHINLGRSLVTQGEFEEAVPHFREFIKENPNDVSGPFELGNVLTRLQRFDEAVLEFRATLQLAPAFVPAYVSLGRVLAILKRPGEAVASLEEALKHDPQNIAAYENLMMVLAQTGQLGKAIQYGRKAVKLSPKSFELRFNLGLMLIGRRQYADGIRQLQDAHRIHPDDPRPVQQIQQAKAAMKNGGR